MPTEIKHLVIVTLKEEASEPQQIFWGELEKELPDRGKRKCIQVRVTSTTKAMDLLMGKSIPVKYLPKKERRDLHKEVLTWPSKTALTIIDNGIINKNLSTSENIGKEIYEAKIKTLQQDIKNLLDFMTVRGIYRLPDEEMMRYKQYMKSEQPEQQKPPITRIEEGKK